jgi:hypothetical protein
MHTKNYTKFYSCTPSVSFYLSLGSAKLYYPETNKKKRREYYGLQLVVINVMLLLGALLSVDRPRIYRCL